MGRNRCITNGEKDGCVFYVTYSELPCVQVKTNVDCMLEVNRSGYFRSLLFCLKEGMCMCLCIAGVLHVTHRSIAIDGNPTVQATHCFDMCIKLSLCPQHHTKGIILSNTPSPLQQTSNRVESMSVA